MSEFDWEAKAPAFQLYVRDVLTDINFLRCTWAAQGVWFRCLCLMWIAPVQGKLEAESRSELCRLIGGAEVEISPLIDELILKRVASSDGPGVLVNRRMFRQAKLKQTRQKSGSKGGKKRVENLQAQQEVAAVAQAKVEANDQAKTEQKCLPASASASADTLSTNVERDILAAPPPPSPSMLDGLSEELKADPEAKHFDLSDQDLGSGRFRLKKFRHMWMHFHELTQAREKFLGSGLTREEWLDCVRICDVSLEAKKDRRDFKGGMAFKYLTTHILTDALAQKSKKNQANGVYGPQPKPTPARRVVRAEPSAAAVSQPVSIGTLLASAVKPTE